MQKYNYFNGFLFFTSQVTYLCHMRGEVIKSTGKWYKVLLEAEMSLTPYVQFASPFEIDHVCVTGNYDCRVINEGTLILPPQMSVTATEWECRNALISGQWSVKED